MEKREQDQSLPLAQIDDPEALKARYGAFRDEILLKWTEAVTGAHREAMLAVLRERGREG